MTLLWPTALYLLGLIPLTIAAYVWILRRRRRFAVRYSSLALVRAALGRQSAVRRHLPFALFLVAMASLIVAMSRPMAMVEVPGGQTTIILAMDVSRSMCQRDILPNRLEAAKAAAQSFVENQEPTTQIGLVAFAGFAELIVPPTNDRGALSAAIASLTTARRTAIGSGIMTSLDALAEIYEDLAPGGQSGMPPGQPFAEPGEESPYIIVLLTDGVSNAGPHPLDAAREAADRGVPVYTIGFGTANAAGPIPQCGQIIEQGDFLGGGGPGGGGGFSRGIDEQTLKEVSAMTGGEYYPATSAGELQAVFESLPVHAVTRSEFMETTVLFSAIGAMLAMLALLLSMIWNPVR
jgi:Ca-activated chloride channel family protein